MLEGKNIVIVGGGFAGTSVAKRLRGRLPSGWRLVMISEESYTTFNPMLPEAVGASIFPEQVIAPLREILDLQRGSQFVMGKVTALDTRTKLLTCATLAGDLDIAYEHLVLAYGNRARLDLVPGMAEHALPLKTVGDAMHIRNIALRRLARIELETDPALRHQLGQFVVIGGGFSGVEVAGELTDCLRSALRFYPGVSAHEIRVSIVQDIDHLLPELPASLGQAAQRSLTARGVNVVLNQRATTITADRVCFGDDQHIVAGTVISTIGTRPNVLAQRLDLPQERGRIVVDADLSVRGFDHLWAAGDCALIPNALDGKFAPPTAQFAVREGRTLADNILAKIQHTATTPFSHRSRGMMAAIGHMKGVAEVMGIPVSGLIAWLIWRAYYLSQMPTFGRKFRILVEWTWGMFFPTDITHLRFTRSKDVAELEAQP